VATLDEILSSLDLPEVRANATPPDPTDREGIATRLSKLVSGSRWRRLSDGALFAGHFAVVERQSPTAFTIEASSNDFLIAVHSGLLQALMNVFARMAHHPAMYRDPSPSGKHERNDLFENVPFASAADGEMLLATLLYRLAVEFLFYHELHHVIVGHAGYMRHTRHGLRMFESGAIIGLDRGRQRPMEYTADLFASKSLYDSIQRRRLALFTPQSLEGLEDHHLMYAGVLAFLTLFCTLQLHDPTESDAYPSLGARTLIFINHWTRASQGEESMTSRFVGPHGVDCASHCANRILGTLR